jgi:hypothetical protein
MIEVYQERMERRSGKRYSSAGSEKMERVGVRYGENERLQWSSG